MYRIYSALIEVLAAKCLHHRTARQGEEKLQKREAWLPARILFIFPDMEFGYRTNFDIYADGVIEIFCSSRIQEYRNDTAAGFDWIKKKRES